MILFYWYKQLQIKSVSEVVCYEQAKQIQSWYICPTHSNQKLFKEIFDAIEVILKQDRDLERSRFHIKAWALSEYEVQVFYTINILKAFSDLNSINAEKLREDSFVERNQLVKQLKIQTRFAVVIGLFKKTKHKAIVARICRLIYELCLGGYIITKDQNYKVKSKYEHRTYLCLRGLNTKFSENSTVLNVSRTPLYLVCAQSGDNYLAGSNIFSLFIVIKPHKYSKNKKRHTYSTRTALKLSQVKVGWNQHLGSSIYFQIRLRERVRELFNK